MSKEISIKGLLDREDVQQRFQEMLGDRSRAFMVSALQVVNSNSNLKKADPMSIYQGVVLAATLDLPLNNNLGFAYLVPYRSKAQFQIGYKGFIQLALRSGQFKTISASEIRKGQLVSQNPLTGFEFDFSVEGGEIIGYASYFELINGFSKTFFMTLDEVKAHAKKYSQSYQRGSGVWKDDFHSMANKTVLKLLLSKYAPLSVEMQKAIIYDQGIVKEDGGVDYADNTIDIEAIQEDQELDRMREFIESATKPEQLANLQAPDELKEIYEKKVKELGK